MLDYAVQIRVEALLQAASMDVLNLAPPDIDI
jgi:hypothetical protein